MAGGGDNIIIRNYNDSTTLYERGVSTDNTIGDILGLSWNSGGAVTALAISIGGTPLPNNTIIANSGAYVPGEAWVFYDVTPQAETITGFYLDGTEYKFEGGGTAEGISTTQPSNPVAGSTYYDTTNNVIKVYNGTAWEEVGGGNVIAMTQAEYEALPEATKNDGKLRIISDAPAIDVGNVSSTDVTTIVVSTSAPASGTTSNIITIVTD